MGGIFTTQTGMLPFFGLYGNETFQNITDTKFPTIGAILEKAGYNQLFINGADLNYAGKGNFLKLQGYKCLGSKELDSSYPREGWGVKDKELFEEAKKRYIELSEKKQPFNLTLLTVATHFPSGYPDDRFRNVLKSKNKDLEYCVEQTDYLLNDFINFLKKQPNYENTAIYIMSDHKMMGNEITVPVTRKLSKKSRDLFFLSNQKNIANYEDNSKRLYFYDIPRIILNGANVKTNVKFLHELKRDVIVDTYYKHRKDMQRLNLSLVSFEDLQKGIKVEKGENEQIIIKSGNKIVDTFDVVKYAVRYYAVDNELKVKGKFSISEFSSCYKHTSDYTHSDCIIVLTANDITGLELLVSDYNKNIYYRQNYEYGKKIFEVGKYYLATSGINIDSKNLKKIFSEAKLIHDLRGKKDLNEYFDYLSKIKKEKLLIIIVARDEASNLYSLYKDSFKQIGIKESLDGKWRQSYVGVVDNYRKVYLDEVSTKKIYKNLKIDTLNIEVTSSGYESGNFASVKVNKIEYCKNRRGLNIIVINQENEKVLDSVFVDTYSDKSLKIQR